MSHDREDRHHPAPPTTPEGATPLEPAAPTPSPAGGPSGAGGSSGAGEPSGATAPAAAASNRGREAVARAVGDDPIARTAAGPRPGLAQAEGGRAAGPVPAIDDPERYRQQWEAIQAGFVDDPGRAVVLAGELVGAVLAALHASLDRERAGFEDRWRDGQHPSTEELRALLQRYRAGLDRLLDG